MAIIGTFTKQPREVIDIDITTAAFFAGRGDALQSYTVETPAGITLQSNTRQGDIIKLLIAGGTTGTSHTVTVLVTTTTGVVAEDEIRINVLEVA